MDLQGKLHQGMRLVGFDGQEYGVIERWDDEFLYVHGERIPVGMIERLDNDCLYLETAGARPFTAQEAANTSAGREVRVPIVEERLRVGKRQIDLGEIRIQKTVDVVEETRQEPVRREDVQIDRVRVNRPVATPETPHEEDGWLIIPVMEEVLVVQRQLVVTEEIRIRKQPATEQREIRETVRREQVSIDDTRTPLPHRGEPPSEPTTGDPASRSTRKRSPTSSKRRSRPTSSMSSDKGSV
jgi:uncharacterized protein (TIGR02271 family)